MKRFFLIYFLLFTTLIVNADEKSAALIAKVRAKVNATQSYMVNFNYGAHPGKLIVSGVKFALISDEAEIYYDGQTIWNYNKKKREVNVENLDPNNSNVMMNPSKLMAVNEKDFSHRSLGANSIELTPKSSSEFYSKIVITVNPTTLIPERIVITERETGEKTHISISQFTSNINVTINNFRFDTKKHKGIDIVDFR